MKNQKELTTAERMEAVKTFKKVAARVASGDGTFSNDEIAATKTVAQMVDKIAASWKIAGAKRDENPSKTALYFRWNRARKALAQAKEAGASRTTLTQLRAEVTESEAAYREAK
jgi:hypothetical protein